VTRLALVLLLLAAGLGAVAGSAAATDVSPERLRELAARARTDSQALAELRRVDAVAGAPVDVNRLLGGADGKALEARLRVLAAGGNLRGAPASRDARRQAREILAGRRFEERRALRPLREPLEWLRDRLRSVVEPIVSRVAPHVPGGRRTVWLALAVLVVAGAAALAARVVRGRAADAVRRARAEVAGPVDPRRLEREADEAERRGELERALRLRFRAGLVRLQRAEAIPARDSLTSGEVARRLRSADFDSVAATFDEVVYGRRRPEPADVESSRVAWSRVLEAARA
jgi:Domain of unknown function (DUF4129)